MAAGTIGIDRGLGARRLPGAAILAAIMAAIALSAGGGAPGAVPADELSPLRMARFLGSPEHSASRELARVGFARTHNGRQTFHRYRPAPCGSPREVSLYTFGGMVVAWSVNRDGPSAATCLARTRA